MPETYAELLEDFLPYKGHKIYIIWKEYALDAIKEIILRFSLEMHGCIEKHYPAERILW